MGDRSVGMDVMPQHPISMEDPSPRTGHNPHSITAEEAYANAVKMRVGRVSWQEGEEGESRRALADDTADESSCWKKFKEAIDFRERLSARVEPLRTLSSGVHVPGIGKVTWQQAWDLFSGWIRQPQNFAIAIWGLLVGISGALLFLVMIGALNSRLDKLERKKFLETCSQTLNALFTFMCLVSHPERLHAAFRLYRWRDDDIRKMRKIYCKDGVRKPQEWAHMVAVVVLLNLNCFFQYCLAGLNWGYTYMNRPAIGVAITFVGAFGCAAAAGVYMTVSPLGRDYDVVVEGDSGGDTDLEGTMVKSYVEVDGGGEGQGEMGRDPRGCSSMLRKAFFRPQTLRFADYGQLRAVEKPEWKGGLFDCLQDRSVCLLTMGCFFCVFGQNMHRLYFGNGYVQTVNFLLFFFSPYLLFVLFAVNVHKWNTQVVIGCIGVVASFLGLAYGGYWRSKMRKTYGLAPHNICGGNHNTADILLWILFPCCSLCQEVRTAGSYDVLDGNFVAKPKKKKRKSDHKKKEEKDEDFTYPMIEDARPLEEDLSNSPYGGQDTIMEAPVPREPPRRAFHSIGVPIEYESRAKHRMEDRARLSM